MQELQDGRGAQVAGKVRTAVLLAFVAIATVVADQFTKAVVLARLQDGPVSILNGFLRLSVRRNSGGILGLFPDSSLVFVVLTSVVVAIVVWWAVSKQEFPIYLGLVAGGGLGNLADRVVRGAVIDFIDIGFWPTFNLADAAISAGVFLIILSSFRSARR